MARRILRTTPSRIFRRRPSLASRLLGGSLLVLSLAITLAGLGTAIYLERAREGSPAAAAVTVAPPIAEAARDTPPPSPDSTAPTSTISDSLTATASAAPARPAAESPEIESTPTPTPPAESPAAAGSSAPEASAPEEVSALDAPSVTVAPLAAPADDAPHYWIEYGVFAGERYAKRLQQALADQGLAAIIVPTHGPGGRVLLRVRSPAIADDAEARASAVRAKKALGITTLLHHAAAKPAKERVLPASQSSRAADPRYWVQFGAFPRQPQAIRLKEALGQSGIDTVVAATHGTSGRLLFLVRSVGLADRGSALAVAQQAQQARNVDFLVGQSLHSSAPRHSAANTRPAVTAVEQEARVPSETLRP